MSHPELHQLLGRLHEIHDAVSKFNPPYTRPPILDSFLDADDGDQGHWSQPDHIPGLKKLKDALKIDLDGLKKFLEDPSSAHRPPLSTNAPYLISVWNELLCAPLPIVSVFKTYLYEPSETVSSSAHRKKTGARPPGAKVDIVADGGRTWIRINTMKTTRLLAEFREIDSYITDSDDDDPDWDHTARPTLAQTHFDNSILKMGRSLLQSAQANPVEGTTEVPKVIMRLTRLDPSTPESSPEADPRIAKTVDLLKEMGIQVQIGERLDEDLIIPSQSAEDSTEPPTLVPTRRINLDLSVLIALISDLSHAPLPASTEEAKKRFIPPKEYREWKQARKYPAQKTIPAPLDEEREEELSIEDLPHDLATHSRALTNQLLNEMSRSMIQEIRNRIDARLQTSVRPVETAQFWVTTEARDRCLRIVSKIGAANEKRRAFALFSLDPSDPTKSVPLPRAEELFWQDSRFNRSLPLFPLHFHSPGALLSSKIRGEGEGEGESLLGQRMKRHPFFKSLAKTCQHILDQETIPYPNSKPPQERFISQPTPFPSELNSNGNGNVNVNSTLNDTVATPTPTIDFSGDGEIQRATVTKANPRLTAHTVESMLWGAELGWTTLTANRTSVKAILKEVKIAKVIGKLEGEEGELEASSSSGDSEELVQATGIRIHEAAIWIMDPRSLAEQMSSSSST